MPTLYVDAKIGMSFFSTQSASLGWWRDHEVSCPKIDFMACSKMQAKHPCSPQPHIHHKLQRASLIKRGSCTRACKPVIA